MTTYPYQQNYYPYQQPQFSQPTANTGINWVSGEGAAKSWMVSRGETVLLMDSENQCFYIKSADASGMPLPLRIFDYTERSQNALQGANTALIQSNDEFVTRAEFDGLRAKYEELEKQIKRPVKREAKADE
ncbi:MAG: hypothetical protein KBT34_09850 [Prevotella sp.]|nr:hypothetical protein [Candidatus Prevotella equi]